MAGEIIGNSWEKIGKHRKITYELRCLWENHGEIWDKTLEIDVSS
jgi:hypothetical protein